MFMFATWILGLGSIYADGFAVPRNVAVAGAFALAVAFAVAVAEVRSSRPMA